MNKADKIYIAGHRGMVGSSIVRKLKAEGFENFFIHGATQGTQYFDVITNAAGFKDFYPDACLINQYVIGTKLGSHQDKNEKDFSQTIVSVSIGLPAIFQIFGNQRSKKILDYKLQNGDVMVWGKSARLVYHGVKALDANPLAPKLTKRINLTFRKSH